MSEGSLYIRGIDNACHTENTDMMKKKYILSFIAAGAVFALALMLISRLVMPKYVSESREGNLISEYYREIDEGREHDVVFIGDCEVYSSFVPPLFYERYGIRSFVRGSPSQSIAESYHLLCETLEYEKPRTVVLGVYALSKSGKSNEAYNRMTLDGMRLSRHKLRAVAECSEGAFDALSYYLPLLRFHSRIFELSGDDLEYIFSRPRVSHNGYLMEKRVMPAKDLESDHQSHAGLPAENLDHLIRMYEACKRAGIELILVKPPLDSWRYPWYSEWDAEIESFASAHGICYYNLIDADIGIDLTSDTYDGGLHLNVCGAEKTTVYFGAILAERFELEVRSDEVWEAKVREYYEAKNRE